MSLYFWKSDWILYTYKLINQLDYRFTNTAMNNGLLIDSGSQFVDNFQHVRCLNGTMIVVTSCSFDGLCIYQWLIVCPYIGSWKGWLEVECVINDIDKKFPLIAVKRLLSLTSKKMLIFFCFKICHPLNRVNGSVRSLSLEVEIPMHV